MLLFSSNEKLNADFLGNKEKNFYYLY